MQSANDQAISAPPSSLPAERRVHRRRVPRVHRWVRFALVLMVVGWAMVFFVAAYLNPYENGVAKTMETHLQLGLLPCTFKEITGVPCPSCGMTTSFALLVRGDLWHSLQANYAGTALAILGLVFIPWALATATLGRVVWIRSVEMTLFRLALLFLLLMLSHWGIAVLLTLSG